MRVRGGAGGQEGAWETSLGKLTDHFLHSSVHIKFVSQAATDGAEAPPLAGCRGALETVLQASWGAPQGRARGLRKNRPFSCDETIHKAGTAGHRLHTVKNTQPVTQPHALILFLSVVTLCRPHYNKVRLK